MPLFVGTGSTVPDPSPSDTGAAKRIGNRANSPPGGPTSESPLGTSVKREGTVFFQPLERIRGSNQLFFLRFFGFDAGNSRAVILTSSLSHWGSSI